MAGDLYTVQELKAILRSCRDSGVTQLQIGNFSATFLPPESKAPVAATLTPEQLEAARKYENDAFLENEKRIREDDLANLRLSDPEAYEDLLARGELINAGEKSDGVDA